jgi:serine/threonine protein kinase/Tol biopolymer transport system component
MTLLTGTRLGRYEIRSPLGAGGMGEVYLARDTKLTRDVAIKVLPDGFTKDEQRLVRFEREARLLAQLNHPHIASIHGLEEWEDTPFLVMEFVSGASLATRIAARPFAIEEVLNITLQIAEALEAAHESGIIHRDLKPSNIQITEDEQVKVLDFGLAKILTDQSAINNVSESPTVIYQGTETGTILGTAAYMSPEQAKGKKVDERTDIWAFGCVLYELLTGKPPFLGETTTETLASIIRAEPDWSLLPDATPNAIRRLLARSLQKDPKNRLRDIGDARIEIVDALSASPETATIFPVIGPAKPEWRRSVLFTIGGLMIGVLLTALAVWVIRRSTKSLVPTVNRFAITLPDNEPLALTKFVPLAVGRVALAISPDGSSLTYVANRNGIALLFLRRLDQFDAHPITGTEGAYNPFFSPDGKWIGFFAENRLKKVSLAGGEPVTLCEARNPMGASWGRNDTIFFGDQEGGTIRRISAAGGAPQPVPVSRTGANHIEVLPDSNWLLYSTWTGSNPDYGEIRALSLETGNTNTVLQGGSNPRYVEAGYLLFTRAGAVMVAPFDLQNRKVTGAAVPMIEGVRSETYGNAQFSVSENGTLVFIPGSTGWIGKPVWVDRQGKITPIGLPAQSYASFKLSPDGKRLAIEVAAATNDIWIYDFDRGTFLRLTIDGNNNAPVWSPDGKRLAFTSIRNGRYGIFVKPADGSGVEEQLLTAPDDTGQAPESWSPEGKALMFAQWGATDQGDIWILPLEGDRKPQPFLRTQFSEFFSSFSPDGHWIVYTSDESGRYEVYVRPYPGPGGKWQISTEGGEEPLWSAKGDELLYRNGEKWMAATVQTKPDFRAEAPRLLFENYFINVPGLSHYVSPDGRRQIMIQPVGQENPKQINVVLNWFAELKLRAPVNKTN